MQLTHFFAILELSVAQSRHLLDDARLPEYIEIVLVITELPSSLGLGPEAAEEEPSSGNIFFSTAVLMGGGLNTGPWLEDCCESEDELFERARFKRGTVT